VGDGLRVVLAYDVGPGIGLGHKRRMEALASALEAHGVTPALHELSGPVSGELVVVDSYRLRADDTSVVDARIVVAVDDLDRDLAVHLVVDPSPGATSENHRRAERVLAGGQYALIDPGLLNLRPAAVGESVARVLVAVGGSDTAGVGPTLASDIAQSLPGATVQLAVGPWSAGDPPPGVEPVRTKGGLGPVLAEADLVVTAAGVTMLEALCLGRPTVAVVLHENQRRPAKGAAELGAVVLADLDQAAAEAARLAEDVAGRRTLSEAASRTIDGRGAARVAAAIAALT
jgi:spore coat polysaccharide biosynthesis predicted glycosyltransferase SpsG